MLKRHMRRPSGSTVIACTALFVALGGTGYAATSLSAVKAETKLVKRLAPSLSVKYSKSAGKAKSATTALGAETATTATYATTAGHASSADNATDATNATNATDATDATNATNATNAINAANATTVGGKTVQQFSVSQTPGTPAATVISVDGITLKAACAVGIDPSLTIENDSSSSAAMDGGYTSGNSGQLLLDTNLTSTPQTLTPSSFNAGGDVTVIKTDGTVVSVLFAGTGAIGVGATKCYFGGTLIAS
jgi:hypothetical protein